MEETYNLKAIILNRRPFGEDGCRITIYCLERGKLELVGRGTKKIKSKLAGHLEPLTLANIMAVRGRRYDYVGAAASENCYGGIKSDLARLTAAGGAIKIFNKIIKAEQADAEIFGLLKDFLDVLAGEVKGAYDFFLWLFVFKLLIKSGYKPELYKCVSCSKKIPPSGNKFNLAKGGLVCVKCLPKPEMAHQLIISENSIKVLRLADRSDFKELEKISLDGNTKKEILNIISLFFNYSF